MFQGGMDAWALVIIYAIYFFLQVPMSLFFFPFFFFFANLFGTNFMTVFHTWYLDLFSFSMILKYFLIGDIA